MRRMVLLLALASSFAAGSCAAVMDREQLNLCRRVLPALHPEGTELREIRLMRPVEDRSAMLGNDIKPCVIELFQPPLRRKARNSPTAP